MAGSMMILRIKQKSLPLCHLISVCLWVYVRIFSPVRTDSRSCEMGTRPRCAPSPPTASLTAAAKGGWGSWKEKALLLLLLLLRTTTALGWHHSRAGSTSYYSIVLLCVETREYCSILQGAASFRSLPILPTYLLCVRKAQKTSSIPRMFSNRSQGYNCLLSVITISHYPMSYEYEGATASTCSWFTVLWLWHITFLFIRLLAR